MNWKHIYKKREELVMQKKTVKEKKEEHMGEDTVENNIISFRQSRQAL